MANVLFGGGLRRFRAGAVSWQMLAGIGIAVVAAVAVGLSIYFSLMAPPKMPVDRNLHFQCTACGKEFTKAPEDMPMNQYDRTGRPKPLDCPLCGAKESAYPMVQCLKCKKYYLPNREQTTSEDGEPTFSAYVCPYCGAKRGPKR